MSKRDKVTIDTSRLVPEGWNSWDELVEHYLSGKPATQYDAIDDLSHVLSEIRRAQQKEGR